jgi:hypothetical protein
VALSGRLQLSRHQAWRGRIDQDGLDLRRPSFMTGTEAGMERLFARSGAGLGRPPASFVSGLEHMPDVADQKVGYCMTLARGQRR